MSRPGHVEYFMGLVDAVARRATCKRHQIGAVIVDTRHRVISTGYNGAPAGMPDCLALGCLRDERKIRSGTEQQICRAIHAEQNALIQAGNTYRLPGATLYCNFSPCVICAKMIINAGITQIVYEIEYPDELAATMIHDAGIKPVRYVRTIPFVQAAAADILKSITDDELKESDLLTTEEIEEALEQGRKEKELFDKANPGAYIPSNIPFKGK